MILSQRHMELGGKTVISHMTFKPPFVAASSLEGHGCFIFPIKTAGEIFREDGKTSVSSGEGVLMKCGTYVNKWSGASGKRQIAEVIILRLYPGLIEENLGTKTIQNLKKRMSLQQTALVKVDTLMKKYLESLFFYFDHPELVNDQLVNLKITELLLLLASIKRPNHVIDLLASLFEQQKFTLQEVVDANLCENLSLEELATLAHMSTSSFKRKFRALFGESPGQYIRNKRLTLAANLLTESNKTVAEISYHVGFSDPNYFSKSFHSKYKCSPSEFRK